MVILNSVDQFLPQNDKQWSRIQGKYPGFCFVLNDNKFQENVQKEEHLGHPKTKLRQSNTLAKKVQWTIL